MSKFVQSTISACALALILVSTGQAEVTPFGWVRADYGLGTDRYGEAAGDDRLGVTQLALGIKSEVDNLTLIGVVGSNALSNSAAGTEVGLKDAFIVWNKVGGSDLSITAGAQPLLFGLKPNGYPGDRSLQGSLEYGAAGAFAVSNQAGPAIKVQHPLADMGKISVGLFDHNTSAAADGSSLWKNIFAQAQFDQLGVEGLYGMAGFETRYVGGAVDSSKPIIDVGAGFKTDKFDISAEFITLDKAISGTADNEQYLVAELTLMPMEGSTLYLDFAQASELDVQTLRVGAVRSLGQGLTGHAEFSMDMMPEGTDDVSSIDVRLALTY